MYVSSRLEPTHDVDGFRCGKAELDDWLTSSALRAHEAGAARVYVWTAADDLQVFAYYAIAPTEVIRADDGVPRSLSGGYTRIPGYLLARLALHESLHGAGLGEQLLIDALERIVAAASAAGVRLIVVDAIDASAATFYRKYGFVEVRSRERRLVMNVDTARAAITPQER